MLLLFLFLSDFIGFCKSNVFQAKKILANTLNAKTLIAY
jgi:hypothetical protein